MPFNASVVFFFTSSTSAKVFLWGLFSFGGIKRSRPERDRVNYSATVFQEFSRCFHPFGRSRIALSEVGLQVTIHHSWSRKTTHKLVFSPVQLSCKLFQALQLFPLPFSLTENRISQPHVVPTIQPSQKSTYKREVHNKKIYYVAPRLHSTMPVDRLMQKGPRRRHLAAEAYTTTGPPTRECFRFLLGPPTYKFKCFLSQNYLV